MSGCKSLEKIYVNEYEEFTNKGWTTKAAEDGNSMFWACTALVGGNGTTYDSSHIDSAYARIDKEGAPGYFTDIKDKLTE